MNNHKQGQFNVFWGLLRGKLSLWIKYGEAKPKLNDRLLRCCPKAFGVVISLSKQEIKVVAWQNSNKSPIKILHNS